LVVQPDPFQGIGKQKNCLGDPTVRPFLSLDQRSKMEVEPKLACRKYLNAVKLRKSKVRFYSYGCKKILLSFYST